MGKYVLRQGGTPQGQTPLVGLETMWGQTPELGFEMVTFLTFLARYGIGGGTSPRMPKGALMSGFEKPPPSAPNVGRIFMSLIC